MSGVWAGNADGEGRPGLVGAPDSRTNFYLTFLIYCQRLVLKPSDKCRKWIFVPKVAIELSQIVMKSNKKIQFQVSGLKQLVLIMSWFIWIETNSFVNSSCEDINAMVHKSWFVATLDGILL
jgi:penicillin-binding protein 1C